MTAMADSKTTLEVNAMKGVALDHLGAIGARLRQDSLDDQSTLKTLPEVSLRQRREDLADSCCVDYRDC